MTETITNTTQQEEVNPEKTFTQSDIDKIIAERLERERKKAEAQRAEAAELAKLSEEERYKAEMQKQREEFEAERKQFARERLELEVTKMLASENLSTEFSSFLIGGDVDSTKANVDAFKSAFQKAVEKAVDERLKGSSKPPVTSGSDSGIKKISEYSYEELLKMEKENPDLYKRVISQ